MRHAGLVRSQRGREGGYWLARPPDEITIADVVRAVEGPLAHVRGEPPESVHYAGPAEALEHVWIAVRANLRAVVEHVTVADVASGRLPAQDREARQGPRRLGHALGAVTTAPWPVARPVRKSTSSPSTARAATTCTRTSPAWCATAPPPRRSRPPRSSARSRAGRPTRPAAAARARGCSASRATPPTTSSAGAAAPNRWPIPRSASAPAGRHHRRRRGAARSARRRARVAVAGRARARRAQVRGGARERGDRRRARHQRDERGHAPVARGGEAEGGDGMNDPSTTTWRELHAMRAEPRPEFARELDQRAAEWLRERPRRRMPSLRIAIPAVAARRPRPSWSRSSCPAAATAAVAARAARGRGRRRGHAGVAQRRSAAARPARAAPEDRSAPPLEREAPRRPAARSCCRARRTSTVTVRYLFTAPTEATVELAGREAEVDARPGSGRLEISTEGLPAGHARPLISTPSAPTTGSGSRSAASAAAALRRSRPCSRPSGWP